MAAGCRQRLDVRGGDSAEGMAAVERALTLDPDLAEAHAVKAQILQIDGDVDAAGEENAIALKLDPESYEVNRSAGRLHYRLGKFDEAIRYFEKAAALMEADLNSVFMLISCYTAVGDGAGTRRAAEMTLKRTESVLARDPDNALVTAYSVHALAALGEVDRAKARMERTLLIDPDNFNMRYNFACMLNVRLKDRDAAVELLEPLFDDISDGLLSYAKADTDLESLHDDPRWQAMVAAAETRLAAAKGAGNAGGASAA